jgi:hypothetical protein
MSFLGSIVVALVFHQHLLICVCGSEHIICIGVALSMMRLEHGLAQPELERQDEEEQGVAVE